MAQGTPDSNGAAEATVDVATQILLECQQTRTDLEDIHRAINEGFRGIQNMTAASGYPEDVRMPDAAAEANMVSGPWTLACGRRV